MRNRIKYYLFGILLLLIPVSVFAANYSYRGKEMNVVYLIGMALLVIRIVVPILLIVTGMIGLVGAMTKNDDRDIKAELRKLVPKVIAAIIIFLLPTLVALLMRLTNKSSLWNEYSKCLSKPTSCNVELWKQETYVPEPTPTPSNPEEPSSSSSSTTVAETNELGLKIVAEAKKYKKKDVGTDCSGFVKKILKKFNLLDSQMKSTSARCDGASRGSYGMYLLYKKRGQIVWERSADAKTTAQAIKTFPGGCQPGDIIFYTYGSGSKINDCVKHVVIYTGYENGKHMIIDSNTQDHIVKYRAIDKIYWAAIPLACARPY